ncbi:MULTISPECIES: hypothetical protein [unclassified Lonepinella]|uniref:hypothetical protein n=1 Tax=unclassified Lonepinella TaxID=2642006 RepID=UPI0036D9CE6A
MKGLIIAYTEKFMHSLLNTLPESLIISNRYYYLPSFGNILYLEHLSEQDMDCIYISDEVNDQLKDISTIVEALASWFYVLKEDGYLVISKTSNLTAQHIQQFLSDFTELSEFDDQNVPYYIVKKRIALPSKNMLLDTAIKLCSQGDLERAEIVLFKLYMLYPRFPFCYLLQANIWLQTKGVDYANALWQRALRHTRCSQNLIFYALHLLRINNYHLGFQQRKDCLFKQDYFSFRSPIIPTMLDKRLSGTIEKLKQKTLLVWSEFGLGDEMMFGQLAYYLKHHCHVAKLIFMVQKPIKTLFETHPDIDLVLDASLMNEMPFPDYDYWVYPHDLLAHVSEPFGLLPKRYPYFFAQDESKARFSVLMQSDKIKIGFVFRGNPTHENDKDRSIYNVALIEPLLQFSEQIQWYCIQKEVNQQERALFEKYSIPYLGQYFDCMADTAGAVAQLDYLVSVDTSVIHLAGSLGVKGFVLVPFYTDWRWGYQGDENLWYPTIKVLRQRFDFNWTPVFERLKVELREIIANRYNEEIA